MANVQVASCHWLCHELHTAQFCVLHEQCCFCPCLNCIHWLLPPALPPTGSTTIIHTNSRPTGFESSASTSVPTTPLPVILTWEEPPGYEDIIGVWYRVRLNCYSNSYSYSNSYVTTVNNMILWEDLAPSTYYCASVRVESVHSQYTYFSEEVCFYTGGSQGECTVR